MNRYTASADGAKITYARLGDKEPELVFIHGGLADRTFWSNQFEAFQERFEVIAPDLAGHGESGGGRSAAWSIQAFGNDIRAVLDAEDARRAILIGNSLGGPAAIEAALLVPERVIGVVGVDTFDALEYRANPSEVRARGSVSHGLRRRHEADAWHAVSSGCGPGPGGRRRSESAGNRLPERRN